MHAQDAIRVHLVRHGEVDNPANVAYGRLPGFGLSARGRRQAQATGEHLLRRATSPLIIASSPLQRAVETATIIQRACLPNDTSPSSDAPNSNAPNSNAPSNDTPSHDPSPDDTTLRRDRRLIEAGTWIEGLPRAFAPAAYLRAALDPHARAKAEPASAIATRMCAAVLDAIKRTRSAIKSAAAEATITDAEAATESTATEGTATDAAAELILVSHQRPIRLARAAFERGFATRYTPLLRRRFPWLLAPPPCSYASVTTLHLHDGWLHALDYWAPP